MRLWTGGYGIAAARSIESRVGDERGSVDNYSAGGGRGETGRVGHDIVDGVGRDLGRVEQNVAHERAIQESPDAEILVGLGCGDCGAKIGVAVADMDVRRVLAVIERAALSLSAIAVSFLFVVVSQLCMSSSTHPLRSCNTCLAEQSH